MIGSMPPVAVFAFNRPDHLRKSLDALAISDGAPRVAVTVFCDAPRSESDAAACRQVRKVAEEPRRFLSTEVVCRDRNLGCAGSVIDGVNQILRDADRVIVVEDDIVLSPQALEYLRRALEEYEDKQAVFSIASWAPPFPVVPADYPYSSYFFPRFHCWGWATWRDRWARNDWTVKGYPEYSAHAFLREAHALSGDDLPAMLAAQMRGEIDSWAVRAEYTRFLLGGVTLYPRQSLALNIGMDGSGRHCAASMKYGTTLVDAEAINPALFPRHVCVVPSFAARFRRIYQRPGILQRVWIKLRALYRVGASLA